MYLENHSLKDFYNSVMDRMDSDLKVEDDDFNDSFSDDYLEGISSGLNAAKHIFTDCYRQACRK